MGVVTVRNLIINVSALQLAYLQCVGCLAELNITAECIYCVTYAVCAMNYLIVNS